MNLHNWKRFLGATVVGCASLVSGTAYCDKYPSRPISLVVPYGPGGNGDLSARALAASLEVEKLVGQPLVVENRTGAGGMIGTQYVQRSQPDGYTLLLARVGSQVVAPALDPVTPYKWNDLTPIALLEIDPYVCVVRKDSPYKSFKDLLAAIKAKPGKISYATTSNMDASVVFAVKAFLNAGLSPDAAIMVPYKGAGATITAVLGKVVDFTCNGLAPYVGGIKAGTLRALVVSTPSRIPESPDTPTASELGMKDLEMFSGWNALFGPPNLPKDIIDYWTGVLGKLKSSPYWLKQVKMRGTLASVMPPAETAKFVGDQFTAYHSLAGVIGPGK